MTNTERLIAQLEHGKQFGYPKVTFAVGRYTGNGVAVVEALRRRGYSVVRNPRTCPQNYTLTDPASDTVIDNVGGTS